MEKEKETEVEGKEMVVVGGSGDPVALIKKRIAIIKEVMRDCMVDGTDYGTIPGCGKKPALLKSGAEKLIVTFQFAPKLDIKKEWLEVDGLRHLNVDVDVTLLDPQGRFLGMGTGSCSTLESKYRYRGGHIVLDEPIPDDYKAKKTEYKEKGFGCKKDDKGNWLWVKYEGKEINKDIADQYNTVKKMAKKRGLVDATLTVSGVSDIFTQDIEEQGRKEKPKDKPADNIPQENAPEEWTKTEKPLPPDYWQRRGDYLNIKPYKNDKDEWCRNEKVLPETENPIKDF